MRITRFLFTAVAVLLPAWRATAAVIGPTIGLPVEWVWARDLNPNRSFVMVSSLRDFAVASNGTDFFVAWRQRGLVGVVGPNGEPPRTAREGVFGIRIDASGNVLDVDPIQLPIPPVGDTCDFGSVDCSPPSGLSMSTDWLAFADKSDSYLACNGGCVRVDSNGTLLDESPIPSLPSRGTVLSDGRNHFVLADGQIFFVHKHARVVANPLAVPLGATASDGDNFLSVAGSQISLFDSEGVTLNVTAMPVQPSRGALTFDGVEYLFFWAGSGPDGPGRYVTRVSTDGEPLDTSPRLASPAVFGGSFDRTYRISFDGMNAVAAWCDVCVHDRNVVPIAVIQKADQADSITGTLVGFTGPMLLTGLALASNSTGISVVVVDGVTFTPTFHTRSFFPKIQFVTTWAPSL